MHYTSHQYSPAVRVYAAASLVLFIVLWVAVREAAYLLAGINVGVLAGVRLR